MWKVFCWMSTRSKLPSHPNPETWFSQGPASCYHLCNPSEYAFCNFLFRTSITSAEETLSCCSTHICSSSLTFPSRQTHTYTPVCKGAIRAIVEPRSGDRPVAAQTWAIGITAASATAASSATAQSLLFRPLALPQLPVPNHFASSSHPLLKLSKLRKKQAWARVCVHSSQFPSICCHLLLKWLQVVNKSYDLRVTCSKQTGKLRGSTTWAKITENQ